MELDTNPTVALVVLTTGGRTEALQALIAATGAMDFDDRLLVGNGVDVVERDGWRTTRADSNLGVPGGRSLGFAETSTDIVLFLDDDSMVPATSTELVAGVRDVFAHDVTIGAVALRVVVTGTDRSLRRWSPRPSTRPPDGIVDTPTFPGNGHALRRSAFVEVGGYLDQLFFKHEETELAWRLLDAGWRVVFAPHLVVEHPATSEARHDEARRFGVRNKLWIARLRLPRPLSVIGCVIATIRAVTRCRTRADLAAVRLGVLEGLGALPSPRRPIRWSTVWRLSRAGRPPVL